jgi:hypothetical protein
MKAKRAPIQLSCQSASPEVAMAGGSRKFYSRPMKGIINGVIVFAVALLAPQILQAQGTMTYLSNVDQASAGSLSVGSDSWLAALFITGTNSSGYTLDSIQLEMTSASGNPSGFTVMIYSKSPSDIGVFPGSSIDTLDGSLNPTTAGIYTYTPALNLTLSASTDYFIVLTAGTTVANGAYDWSFMNTASYNPSGGWLGAVTLSSGNGSSLWTRLGANSQYDYSEFSIDAIPIPEPCVLALSGLGGLLFLWHRRKSKVV